MTFMPAESWQHAVRDLHAETEPASRISLPVVLAAARIIANVAVEGVRTIAPAVAAEVRYRRHKLHERVLIRAAWALPKDVAYWAAIRLMAHATTGAFSGQVVPELTVDQALQRWHDPRGGDRRVGGQP